MEIRTGMVVQLRSGGPAMTVAAEGATSDSLVCLWFDDAGLIHEYTLHKDTLEYHPDFVAENLSPTSPWEEPETELQPGSGVEQPKDPLDDIPF